MKEELANLIFNDLLKSADEYEKQYPKRVRNNDQYIVRYAPSPTGFQHIGGVYTALINERLAHQSGGVLYLRVEDTDQKREVKGAIKDLIDTMNNFGIDFDEGMLGENTQSGIYAPYKQSLRGDIYKAFAKRLILQGLAYPCFCSSEEINELREEQIKEKITPGYYGEYAKCRNLTDEEAIERIKNGEEYIIRLKSPGKEGNRTKVRDLIKGELLLPESLQDIVIIKSDGLPTYHFAHVIDDALMGTTHVIRGEEWLPSFPIHLQLFKVLNFETPYYAHVPTVMKMDNGSKRKLSKRKDPESAVSYYREKGYPEVCVIEYLLNIINSSFEEWREEHKDESYKEFKVSLEHMSKSGALFDIKKLNDISKNIICRMSGAEVYSRYVNWAKEFDKEMYILVIENEDIIKKALSIDKDSEKERKDFAKWDEVREKIYYFIDDQFYKEKEEDIQIPQSLSMDNVKEIVKLYIENYPSNVSTSEEWFEHLKNLSISNGFAANKKEFKKNPDGFKGMVSDFAGAIRSAITHRINTPDLYVIIDILGEKRIKERLEKFN
ncbi:MAG: glutamate--tRNA ligase [Clostridium sp.]|uniref:glutamate--tRNA ligase n=1 Tax=Clostridium sp. TaxID=1506 RepID=UPI003F2B8003